ncbi:hypothetical protein AB9R81_15435 [Vibrio cyclitrophicus]
MSLFISEIAFISETLETKFISFDKKISFIYGASNTGKSYLLDVMDFMLGKESIDHVPEAVKYQEIRMKIKLSGSDYTLFRGMSSNNIDVYNGYIDQPVGDLFLDGYRAKYPTKKIKSISEFYMSKLNVDNQLIVTNLWGEKAAFTIRFLSRIILSTEERILSKKSPIEKGDSNEDKKNRQVFRVLLTGKNDNDVVPVRRGKELGIERSTKVEVIEELIEELAADLNYPKETYEDLLKQRDRLELSESEIKLILKESKEKISDLLKDKKRYSSEITTVQSDVDAISLNKLNFEYLMQLYDSDINRLKSQEESAFYLLSKTNEECRSCGSILSEEAYSSSSLELLAQASVSEIKKIERKKIELRVAKGLIEERETIQSTKLLNISQDLIITEGLLEERTKYTDGDDRKLDLVLEELNFVKTDILITERINSLKKQAFDVTKNVNPKTYDTKDFYPSKEDLTYFCEIYKEVLDEIKFPYQGEIEFDMENFDVIIGGKLRRSNGKGVRAILHSIFKISLLLYCERKKLFHPRIVILDSPLVTYRGPDSKLGKLADDEIALKNTKLSDNFIAYLNKIRNSAQFIVIENIELTEDQLKTVSSVKFYGDDAIGSNRGGLL